MQALAPFRLFLSFSSVVVLTLSLMSQLRAPGSGSVGGSNNANTVVTPPSSAQNSSAVVFVSCSAACGDGVVECTHHNDTGLVISCGPNLADEMACTQSSWCSTQLTDTVVRPVHEAIFFACLRYSGNNWTLAPTEWSSNSAGVTQMTASANWTAVLQPNLGSPYVAIELATLYLRARRVVNNAGVLAKGWLDDQSGWWRSSRSVYNASVPLGLGPYLWQLKSLLCDDHWVFNATSSQCFSPM